MKPPAKSPPETQDAADLDGAGGYEVPETLLVSDEVRASDGNLQETLDFDDHVGAPSDGPKECQGDSESPMEYGDDHVSPVDR